MIPTMRSRGALYFHRLLSVEELGLGNPEPFVNRVIYQFLRLGEAVAGRWIEMPQGILILQLAPERPDSGAAYLYDRRQQVFYMLGFDGPDDNLTLEEFNQLYLEYDLLTFAEQPDLALKQRQEQPFEIPSPDPPAESAACGSTVSTSNCIEFPGKRRHLRTCSGPRIKHVYCQRAGSA